MNKVFTNQTMKMGLKSKVIKKRLLTIHKEILKASKKKKK